jgi:2-(1,2-epoxy-1,2-dihydrophenyl)acetyl-CoA isomerase
MPVDFHDRITYDLVDRVARIELAHARANSLDRRMGEALSAAAKRAGRDAISGAARVVVVSARGPHFSVGGDLAAFAEAPDRGAEVKATADGLHAGLVALRALDVPVVSVINGTAAGGGLGIGLIGDVVIAAAEAKLVMAYTASGLAPDCGLSWMIPNRLSWARAMDLTLTNRVLTGAEAADWGLVSRSVPAADLPATVEAVVSGLREGATDALANAKRLMRESGGRTMADHMDHEAATISRLIVDPDGVEGVDAFLAKRQPSYGARA